MNQANPNVLTKNNIPHLQDRQPNQRRSPQDVLYCPAGIPEPFRVRLGQALYPVSQACTGTETIFLTTYTPDGNRNTN